MSTRLRWAVYRDAMTGPTYLGDVLAGDRAQAIRFGVERFGGAVVAHRTAQPGSISPALEHAVRTAERRRRREGMTGRARRGGR